MVILSGYESISLFSSTLLQLQDWLGSKQGRAENTLNEELHFSVLISQKQATKVPFSSQGKQKYFEF